MGKLRGISKDEKIRHTILDGIIPQKALMNVPQDYILRLEVISKRARALIKNPTEKELASFVSVAKQARRSGRFWAWLSENTQVDELLEVAQDPNRRREFLSILKDASKGKMPEGLEGLKDEMEGIIGPEPMWKVAGKAAIMVLLAPLVVASQLSCGTSIQLEGEDAADEESEREGTDAGLEEEGTGAYDTGVETHDAGMEAYDAGVETHDAGAHDTGAQAYDEGEDSDSQQELQENDPNWVVQEMRYESREPAMMLVQITEENPLPVAGTDGEGKNISGEFLYLVPGSFTSLSLEGVPLAHAYLDPTGGAAYCAVEGGYEEVPLGELLPSYEGDWASFFEYAREAANYINDLKSAYLEYLKTGAGLLGLDADFSFLDEKALLSELSKTQVVFTRDTAGYGGNADIKSMSIRLPVLLSETELDEGTLTHEFSHLVLKSAQILSLGTASSAYGPTLHEGETDVFAEIVRAAMGESYGTTYLHHQYVVMAYAYLLGGDAFFRCSLAPGDTNLHDEMDKLLGEEGKHLALTSYFYSGWLKRSFGDGTPFTSRFLRLVGELEKNGVNWKEATEKTELLVGRQGVDMDFFGRFGMEEGKPILEQAQNGTAYVSMGLRPREPFDLRTELANPPEKLRQVLRAVPLLLSLDCESYDIPTQQVALGIWRETVESFASYWNGLSQEERENTENLMDKYWFCNAAFALGARFGISTANIYDKMGAAGSNEILLYREDFGNYNPSNGMLFTTKTLHLSEWEIEPPAGEALSLLVEEGAATLVPESSPWSLERIYPIGNGQDWKVSLSAQGEITLRIKGGKATIEGLEIGDNSLAD